MRCAVSASISTTTLVASTILLAVLAAPAAATTYVVQPDGSGDFATIQEAVLACVNGDAVRLGSGVFTGPGNRDVDFYGRNITIASLGGDPAGCIIDCQASSGDRHRGFVLQSNEGPSAVLRGIKITGGYAPDSPSIPGGGAVLCYGSVSPLIEDCVFEENHSGLSYDHAAGAIYIDQESDPTIRGCVFRKNSAYFGGAVGLNHYSYASLEYCVFIENTGVLGGAVWGNACTKDHCIFLRNSAEYGGAIWGNGWDIDVSVSCTYAYNSVSMLGGAFFEMANYGGPVQIIDSIIAFSTTGAGIYVDPTVPLELSCTDIHGNAGGDWIEPFLAQVDMNGNFGADPCFCDAELEDLQLCADSWCLAGHHPWGCSQLVGALGEGCGDCSCGGPVPTERNSWGELKVRYGAPAADADQP